MKTNLNADMAPMATILSMDKFGAAYGERIVLSSIELEVPETGVVTLMGPGGTGKSTLIRTIAGISNHVPSFRSWGQITYLGYPLLCNDELPKLVAQNARLMMSSILENIIHELPERNNLTQLQQRDLAARILEHANLPHLATRLDDAVVDLPLAEQRHLAITRTCSAGPKLVCIDEPTTGLSDAESTNIIEHIKQESERRAIIVVLHNMKQARQLDGNVALLAGGWIQECCHSEKFFTNPDSEVTRNFIRSGSCNVPSPNAKQEELDEFSEIKVRKLPREAKQQYKSDAFGPRGFLWLKKGQLAGTPRPGIVSDIKYDLEALKRVGITHLVSLTTKPVTARELAPYDITGLWMPIQDMGSPRIDEAIEMCIQVSELIAEGYSVAYHCKAGLGRTGTMLAAQLIWNGSTALDALEEVRRIEPRWVQSDDQVTFLEQFSTVVKGSQESS